MSLHIENPEVERLVAEVAAATGETPDETLLRAMLREKERSLPSLEERVRRFREGMERDVWSRLPSGVRGTRMTREEEDEALGYGAEGHSDH